MSRIPIGLQLYSVRADCQRDLAGTLAQVAQMGYEGVEFAGFYDHSAEQIRQLLDENGLACCGSHQGITTLLGDELDQTVEFNRTIGNPYLICPGLPAEYTESRDAWLRTAALFNEISAKLRPLDMWTGYHNHYVEFEELDGELPWDTFFGNTDPEVIMQLDTGNALKGGGDPVPYVERYPGRSLTVHLKEYTSSGEKVLIGEGEVEWAELFQLCESVGQTRWYIVEQESYTYPPLECVDRCLQNLRAMGK
jgi:sugar phosphate isomerase/epimerase